MYLFYDLLLKRQKVYIKKTTTKTDQLKFLINKSKILIFILFSVAVIFILTESYLIHLMIHFIEEIIKTKSIETENTPHYLVKIKPNVNVGYTERKNKKTKTDRCVWWG